MACSGVFARELDLSGDVVEAGEAIPKRPEGDRHVSLTAEHVVASESEQMLNGDSLPLPRNRIPVPAVALPPPFR